MVFPFTTICSGDLSSAQVWLCDIFSLRWGPSLFRESQDKLWLKWRPGEEVQFAAPASWCPDLLRSALLETETSCYQNKTKWKLKGRKEGAVGGLRKGSGTPVCWSSSTKRQIQDDPAKWAANSPECHLFQQVSIHLLCDKTFSLEVFLYRRGAEGRWAEREEAGGILRWWAGQI